MKKKWFSARPFVLDNVCKLYRFFCAKEEGPYHCGTGGAWCHLLPAEIASTAMFRPRLALSPQLRLARVMRSSSGVATPKAPYWAVIFTSERTGVEAWNSDELLYSGQLALRI